MKNDCEEGEGVDLARTYEVRVYPTYAMVDQAGEVTDRWAGYEGVDRFIAQTEAALADRSSIVQKKERFAVEPTLALALSLAQHAEATFASTEAVGYFRAAMELDPSLAGTMRGKIFLSMYYGLRSEDFTVDQLLAEGRAILDDPDKEIDDVMQVAAIIKRAASASDYVPFLRRALEATAAAQPADDDQAAAVAGYRRGLAVDEALLIERDRASALRLRREALPDDWEKDLSEVHRFVWWCHENDLNLDEAHSLAVEAAELAADDANRASVLSTAASLAYKLGDLEQAVAHQAKAAELSPARERYKQALALYEETRGMEAGEVVEPRTGFVYPDRLDVDVDGRRATLALTGVGVRLRTIMKREVYTIASYVSIGIDLAVLAEVVGDRAEAVRVLDAPKSIIMDLRRDVRREQLFGSLTSAIARNYQDSAIFDDDLATFEAFFNSDPRKGDRIVFGYMPGAGLVTSINGEVKGIVAGRALAEALWTVWFGRRPTDGTLKEALLSAQ